MSVSENTWHKLAYVVALTPLTWATLVHTAWPSRPQSLPKTVRPALAFNQYMVDLGRVQPTTEIRGTFLFENRGERSVTIQKVTPSCGCLRPVVTQETLAPGEEAAIVLRMQPANELPGRKEFYADVEYTDPEPRMERITFRMELPEKQLSVKPRALVIYQTTNEPTIHPLSVADSRPNPASIRGATVNSPFATVEFLSTADSEEFGKIMQLQVTISPELPAGRHEALVTIETDDPASPVLKVPVLMYGRNRETE